MGGRVTSISCRIALISLCGLALPGVSQWDAAALDCINYTDYLHRGATVPLAGAMRDVVVTGDLLYAVGSEGLHVLDRGDPRQPVAIAHLPEAPGVDLALAPGIACLVTHPGEFRTVDIADPESPSLLGELLLPDYCWSVVHKDGLAFVAAGGSGMIAVDVSDPAQPTISAIYDTPHTAYDIALRDDLAFIADGHELVVISLDRTRRASASPGGRPGPHLHAIALFGNFAYLLDSTFGINVFDITDPFDPIFVTSVSHAGYGKLEIVGDLLYAGCSPGLVILSLAFGGELQLVGEANLNGESTSGIAVDGESAYLTVGDPELTVLDVSNPRSVEPVASTPVSYFPRSIEVSRSYAYVSCGGGGLRIVDMSVPEQPILLADHGLLGYAEHADVVGDLAYVATGDLGFEILDVSVPAKPAYLGGWITWGHTTWVDVEGTRAYVTDRGGLLVINVADPEHPVRIGEIDTPGEAVGVAIAGEIAFVADEDWLHAVDVSDPYAPSILSSVEASAVAVAIRGDYAFVVGRPEIAVYDVSDPAALIRVDALPLPGWPVAVSLLGPHAYVAGYYGGLQLVDISTPAALAPAGAAPAYTRAVFAADDCVITVDHWQLHVFPVNCDLTGLPGQGLPLDAGRGAPLVTGHPNPFGPLTSLRFHVESAGEVQVTIHDARGRLLRSLANARFVPGAYELSWDGRDGGGRTLPAGVYWARVECSGRSEGIKLTLLR